MPGSTQVRVVIVDNCVDAPVRASPEELSKIAMLPVELLREPRRGISQARNRAVWAARGETFIAFVDDDEVVEPAWLAELLAVQSEYGADAVAGPVSPTFPRNAPVWAVDSGVYERRRWATGTSLERAATGNVLVSAQVFDLVSPWFDESLGSIGGEDTEFFERVARTGLRIVWADGAEAWEEVTLERLRLGWVLRRWFRIGSGMALQMDRASPRSRTRRVVTQAAIGVSLLPRVLLAAPRSPASAVALAKRMAMAIGRCAGHLGYRYREYE